MDRNRRIAVANNKGELIMITDRRKTDNLDRVITIQLGDKQQNLMMMKNFFNGKNKQIVHDIKNSEKRNVVVVVVILIGLDRSVFVWLL